MNIITGAAGSGKTTEIFKRIAALGKNEKCMLVVPGQYTYHTERKLLDVLGVSACAHVEVCSPERLAYTIASQTALARKKVLSKEAKALLTRYITDTRASLLDLYRSSAFKKGFADDVSVLISELLRNSLLPKQLEKACEKSDGGILERKLKDVCALYDSYFEVLSERYTDPDNFLEQAALYVPDCAFIKHTHFFFDGFYTFDKADCLFIAALDKASLGLTLALTYEDDPFYEITRSTLADIAEVCPMNERKSLPPRSGEGALFRLRENFIGSKAYEQPEEKTAAENTKGAITLYEAPDIREEVRYVASEIAYLTRKYGYFYRDFAVSCPQIETYSPYIEDIFSDYGIPFFTDVRRQIVYTSPVRAFLFLLAGEEGSMQDMIAYAKCGFTDATAEECETIENYALEFGIKGDMFRAPLTRNNETERYDLGAINAIREKLIKPMLRFEEAVKNSSDTAQWCENVYSFLSGEGFEEKIRIICEDFTAEGDYENANIYAQIYNKIIEALESLHGLFAEKAVDKKLLYRMLSYALSVSDVGVIPSVTDKVNIGDVLRSRAGDVKVFFLMGATEGLLGAAHSSAAILTDKDKNTLRELGVKLTNTSDYRKKKEDFILYTLLCLPEERLYVSRYLYEEGDDGRLPEAELFETLTDMFGKVSAQKKPQELYLSVKSAFDALCTELSQRKYDPLRDTEYDAYFDMLLNYFEHTPALTPYMHSANTARSFTNEASLKRTEGKDSLSPPSSVSRLEKYAQCPFSYFMEYVIRPKERTLHKVRHADTGTVLHKVIEVFSRMLIDGAIDPKNTDETETALIIGEICEQEITRYRSGIYKALAQSRYLKSKLIRTAVSAASEILRQLDLSDFLLAQTEAVFAEKGVYMPIYIKDDDGREILLRGKIDRVDACTIDGKKYIKIVDYKSGAAEFDVTRAYYGLNMQLPVYISAALSGDDRACAAGVFYLHLKRREAEVKKSGDLALLEKQVRASFKLSGIVLKDVKVIKALDKTYSSDSFIEGIKVKDGVLADSDALMSEEAYSSLIEHTKENIRRLSAAMTGGDISIRPYRYVRAGSASSPCGNSSYKCAYASVCKFSTCFEGNSYNYIYPLSTKSAEKVFSPKEED